MRIVQLANFHGPSSGGIRTALREWRHGYRAAGHEVHLIVPGRSSRSVPEDGGAVHFVAAPSIPRGGGYRLITSVSRVRRLLDEVEPDAVEVSDRTTLVTLARWAAARGVHSTLVLHERLDNQLRALVPSWVPNRRMVDLWSRSTLLGFDAIVATSRYGAEEATRIGVEPVMVPLGVDAGVFRPLITDPRRDRRRVVFLGRLSRDKRPDLALDAVRELRLWGHEVELLVIGEGPLRARLQAESRDMPVSFTGFVDGPHHVSSLLAGADVSIAPCPGECFGLAALESLACGTPVVVAADSGAAELVRHGGGMAVPPRPRRLALAVAELLTTSRDVRTEARFVAEQYPWRRSVESMLAVHGRAVVPG